MRPSDLKLLRAIETFARTQATAWTALAQALADAALAAPTPPPEPAPARKASPEPEPQWKRHVALTDVEVAERLGVSRFAVRSWRAKGIGPKFMKVGRAVRYKQADVAEYEMSRKRPDPPVTGAADDRR